MKLRRLAPPSELGNMFGTGLSKQDARDGTCNDRHENQIYVVMTWKQLNQQDFSSLHQYFLETKHSHVQKGTF